MTERTGVSGLLGIEPDPATTGPGSVAADPFIAALALDAAKSDPHLNDGITDYLSEHRQLVRLQIKHFQEERRLIAAALKRKRYNDRARNIITSIVALLALTALGGFGVMLWQATQDHGLIVEPFSVPPDLAQRGLSGQIVARQVLDRLSDMQAQTESMRPADSYQNNWGDDIKVVIPETGISLSELRRFLHASFGHQTRISGEIFRTDATLTVVARVGDQAGKILTGTEPQFDDLIRKAAESIYEGTQPYRYSVYLHQKDRLPEAFEVLTRLTRAPDPVERAWAHLGIGYLRSVKGDALGTAEAYRAALQDVPDFAPAMVDLIPVESNLGHDEAALVLTKQFANAARSVKAYVSPDQSPNLKGAADLQAALLKNDLPAAAAIARHFATDLTASANLTGAKQALAYVSVLGHDLATADAAVIGLPADDPNTAEVLGLLAMEHGDPKAIAYLRDAAERTEASPAQGGHEGNIRSIAPWLAIAQAKFGETEAASSLIATLPEDCYVCQRARGIVLASIGDTAGYGRAFSEAIRQAPDLPQAYVERGQTRLADGDAAGAAADAARAAELGPHDPDAYKLWGDALAHQGQWRQAVVKYDAALGYAPSWDIARTARDAAARHL